MQLEPPNTDLWQHAASLRALSADLLNPANPFVVSPETSRHFQPFWVVGSFAMQTLGITEWHVLAGFSFLSMGLLAVGVYSFARVFFASRWAPLTLLFVLLYGWGLQPTHTGIHAITSLTRTGPYPATLMIGAGFLLWAWVIRALDDPSYNWRVLPLTAVMLTTHQLGAVIGFVPAILFVAFWPNGALRARIFVTVTLGLGVMAAMLWPYHNPIALMLQPGHSDWDGGEVFRQPIYLMAAFFPAIIGLSQFRKRSFRPVLCSFLFFTCVYASSFWGVTIGVRFHAPMALMMQIGLAGVIVKYFPVFWKKATTLRLYQVSAALLCIVLIAVPTVRIFVDEILVMKTRANQLEAAQELTNDIPNDQAIVASEFAVWPVVATGQRVLSIPWPEPGIHDLRDRQKITNALLDPVISAQDRLALAREHGIRTIVVSARYFPAHGQQMLNAISDTRRENGEFIRFDLFDLQQ
ncbi:MAG: hypothetical protein AAFQ09_07850 [Pseudomonadota bacterium]